MINYYILNLNDSEKWNECLRRLPKEQQDIYYTPEYYRLYEKLGDGNARCFVYEEAEEIAIYPFLLNSVNELGYDLDTNYFDIQGAYGYNGIVSSNYTQDFKRKFYSAFDDFCQTNYIIAEFTRFHPLLKNELFSDDYLQVAFDRKTIFIDLKCDYSKIFVHFQTTTRKQIKRATNRYAMEVEISEKSTNRIDEFMDIYHKSLRRINSDDYLYFTKSYFEELLLTTKSVCFFALIKEKPIACIIAFYNDNYIHGHLGGALTEYMNLSPFSLLYSEMIKFGQEKGCKTLHVGGGATTQSDDPLLKFKLNFSNSMADFHIGRKIYNQKIYGNVVKQWDAKCSPNDIKYKNFLLKYRY